jgi:hypothetical protein
MAKNGKDTLSPELVRLLKIFGLGSLIFVLVMSFFNEKKANNSGTEPSPMRMADAERIFFKNVRSVYYDIENRRDAKMTVYRHGNRVTNPGTPNVGFSIILNQYSQEAYIYLESNFDEMPIRLRWSITEKNQVEEIAFDGGDKFAHFEFAQKVAPLLSENTIFEVWTQDKWIRIWEDEKEKKGIIVTMEDYQRLIGNIP